MTPQTGQQIIKIHILTIYFKGVSIARNCLRWESGPLNIFEIFLEKGILIGLDS